MSLATAVIVLSIVLLVIDVGYWIKTIVIAIIAKCFRRKISFTSASEIYGMVLPSQSGFLAGHMNNAIYFRELDFARMEHAIRTGMISQTRITGGGIAAAHTIRYRLPIRLFALYKIVTKPVCWDSKFVYMDQRVVTVLDGITRSVAYTKVSIGTNPLEYLSKRFKLEGSAEIPEDVKDWMKFNETSSNLMKKESS